MEKLVITITCDSTMSYPRNPHNPKGVPAQAEEYIRSVNAGASICHLHGPYTVDKKIQADGTKLSDLFLPGWLELTTLIKAKVQAGDSVRHRQRPLSAARGADEAAARYDVDLLQRPR